MNHVHGVKNEEKNLINVEKKAIMTHRINFPFLNKVNRRMSLIFGLFYLIFFLFIFLVLYWAQF